MVVSSARAADDTTVGEVDVDESLQALMSASAITSAHGVTLLSIFTALF